MDKRKIAWAALMTVSVSAVAVSGASANTTDEQQWISEDSGIIVNPSVSGTTSSAEVVSSANLDASNLAELTSLIENELSNRSTFVSIHYTGNTANMMADLKEIIDNYRFEDDYLRGTLSSWKYGYKGYTNDVTITLELNYLTTPSQEEFIQSEVERIVDEIITPSMSTVEKVKAINDYVVLHTTYSEETTTTPHAVYSILTEGKGVCQAYALLALRLMQEAGIEARYVTGESRGIGHAWNLVKIDGKWYHLDTTWNDPVFADSSIDRSDYISYKYFLITDDAILEDHIIDDLDYPAATSERFMAFRDITKPVQVGTTLYFPSESEDIQLYKLDLSKEPYQTEKVSSTRVQELVYADGWLYFSNYSRGGYLSKMKLDGSELTTLLNQKVDTVKLEGNELVASYRGVELYREAIRQDVEVGQEQELEQIRTLINSIEYLSPDFESQANQLKNLYDSLTENSRLLLSSAERTTINSILTKYETMKNLSFNDTVQWDQTRNIKESKKQWVINFSQEVANTAANKAQVSIVDMFGDAVEADVTIQGTQIIITPVDDYVANIPYTLMVKTGLVNIDGTKVKNGVHLRFELN